MSKTWLGIAAAFCAAATLITSEQVNELSVSGTDFQLDGKPSPGTTLYQPNGNLRAKGLETLKAILDDARAEGTVIQLCLFPHKSFREKSP